MVVVWLCFSGGGGVVVFLWWWWRGGIFVVVCGGVFVVALLFFFCGAILSAILSSIFSKGNKEILPLLPEVLLAQLVEPQSCKA